MPYPETTTLICPECGQTFMIYPEFNEEKPICPKCNKEAVLVLDDLLNKPDPRHLC